MKSILLLSHSVGSPGPIHKFYTYLKKEYNTAMILHPFWGVNEASSLKYKNRITTFRIFSLMQYFLEGIYDLLIIRKQIKIRSFDLAICFDPLCFFHVYMLRKLLRIKKIVYYNVDYSEHRFANMILNYIYTTVNNFAYSRCDYFFSLTRTFITNVDPKEKLSYKNYIVSNIVEYTSQKNPSKIKYSLVYAGSLGYSLNFGPLLHALKKLVSEEKSLILDIYGKGILEVPLSEKIKKLGLEKNVYIKRLLSNEMFVNDVLPHYMISVSPYVTKKTNHVADHVFTGTDFTLKIVDYIAVGLPVITTRLNPAFEKISSEKLGFLVQTSDDWYKAIKELLHNERLYKKYVVNASRYAKKYHPDNVLKPVLKKIFQ